MYFDEFDLADDVLDGVDSMNFVEASPIQERAIPPLLQGRDLLGVAQTGTGKTAAYLLPIINRIHLGEFPDRQLKAVVIVPTRELAQQIDRQIQGFGYYAGITSTAIYGGTDGIVWEQQRRSIERGADIVVATPGRLIDLVRNKQATIKEAGYLVIDEADRMLEMGFYEDIIAIRKQLPKQCQIALFSATMPEKIRRLAEALLRDPVKVDIAISKPRESIMQCCYTCRESQKMPLLLRLFEQGAAENRKIVVFLSSKKMVQTLTDELRRMKLNASAMHSDLEQKQRDVTMRDFASGRIPILVATDIVARGIDIDDIDVVVNYDLPHDPEDYVHRIGRTARGTDGDGLAISIVEEKMFPEFDRLQQFLGKPIVVLPLPEGLGTSPAYSYNPDATPEKKKRKRRPRPKVKKSAEGEKKPMQGKPRGRRRKISRAKSPQ